MEKEDRTVNTMSVLYAKEDGILSEYMDYLYDVKKLAMPTAYNYYMTLRTLAKYLKNKRSGLDCEPDETVLSRTAIRDFSELTQAEWTGYVNYYLVDGGATAGSMAVRISIIRGFYNWLENMYAVPAPLFLSCAEIAAPSKRPFVYVTPNIADHLFQVVAAGSNATRNLCILRVTLHCGLALQELCDLSLDDIELDSLRIRSHNKDRSFPLDQETSAAIENYLKDRLPPTDGSNAFFVSVKKGRMRRGAVEKMLRKAVQKMPPNYPSISLRDLQMTAKTNLVAAHGDNDAYALSNVTVKKYFRRVYQSGAGQQAG